MDGEGCEPSDHTLERELAIVAALRQAGASAGPRPDEVDRIRQRVMAGFAASQPGITATTRVDDASGSRVVLITPGGRARRSRGRHRAPTGVEAPGRIAVTAAAALSLFLSLSGMSLLLSQDAL
ncbi:MAG: hypothetical protein M3308_00670, partial [Actinomycetota bacterium]|nr:hypothetical protein [Actinomycetota bacterium]